LKNTKISIFDGLWAKFGKIMAVLGSFGLIWALFAAFTVAYSMPKARLKSIKPHNS
jgi:hypothetical protein